jgi:Uma2 family endonuclease
MPVTSTTRHRLPAPASRAPRPRIVPLTVEQYHRMIETRILAEDTSIELLNGLLVRKDRSAKGSNKMTIGPLHNLMVKKLTRLAGQVEALGCHIQTQGPVSMSSTSEPEPDAAIIRGTAEDYARSVPTAAHVVAVFEIADSSLNTDRTTKLRIYASAGVLQYVIVNLQDEQVDLHTNPIAGEGRYATVSALNRDKTLRLDVSGKTIQIPVRQLLP